MAARRTHSQTLKHATLAVERNTHIEGVKGPSILFLLPRYDFISGLVPDYIHCALLGVCFKFLKLWLTKVEAYFYINHASHIDDNLFSKKFSNEIRRTPRPIEKLLYLWKASEFRKWHLFYSTVALKHLLSPKNCRHWLLFARAFRLLFKLTLERKDVVSLTASEIIAIERKFNVCFNCQFAFSF